MAWNTIEMKESIISENGKRGESKPTCPAQTTTCSTERGRQKGKALCVAAQGKSSVNSLRFLQTPRRMKAWEGMTCRAYDDDN